MKLSEPRQALAAAIDANTKAAKEAERAEDRVARARAALLNAQIARETAETAVEAAKQRHAERFEAGGAAGELRAARAALVEADDDVDGARLSLERAEAGLPDAAREARKAKAALDEAVAAVVADEAVEARIAEVTRLQHELDHRRAILKEISLRQPFVPGNTGVGRRIEVFLGEWPFKMEARAGIGSSQVDEWRTAVERLAADASAPLPGGEDPAPAKLLRLAR
jgi:hypothetical protein